MLPYIYNIILFEIKIYNIEASNIKKEDCIQESLLFYSHKLTVLFTEAITLLYSDLPRQRGFTISYTVISLDK